MAGISARRYAQALFELSREQNKEEVWLGELQRIQEIFSDEVVTQYLNVPQVPIGSTLSITAELLSDFDELLKKAIGLIVSRGSITALSEVVSEYSKLVDQRLGRTRAEVTSAVDLTKAQETKLLSLLKSMLGTEVMLSIKIKSEILGGMLIQIGDQIIDGSVKTRLESLRQELKRDALISEVS